MQQTSESSFKSNQQNPSRRFLQYQKRGDKKSLSLCLNQELTILQEKYPDFKLQIKTCVAEVKFAGNRTPELDRQLVIDALRCGCATIDEIAEETGLPEEDCKQILDDLLATKIAVTDLKGGLDCALEGWRLTYYFLNNNCSKI